MEKQSWHSWSSTAPSYAEFISSKIYQMAFQVKAPHILNPTSNPKYHRDRCGIL